MSKIKKIILIIISILVLTIITIYYIMFIQKKELNTSFYIEKGEGYEKIVNNLKEQITTLKLGEAIKSSSDITEVKLKINNLVRKIDKCVGMITKTEQQ